MTVFSLIKRDFRDLLVAPSLANFGQHFPLPVRQVGEDGVIRRFLMGQSGELRHDTAYERRVEQGFAPARRPHSGNGIVEGESLRV